MNPTIKVRDVWVLYPYRLAVFFSDGSMGRVDLSEHVKREPYLALQEPEMFRKARVERGAVEWPCNVGIAPEALHALLEARSIREAPMVKVTSVELAGPFTLRLGFSDGIRGVVNLSEHLVGPVFEAIRESQELFAKATLDEGVVTWPNGADFAPEFLHTLCSLCQEGREE